MLAPETRIEQLNKLTIIFEHTAYRLDKFLFCDFHYFFSMHCQFIQTNLLTTKKPPDSAKNRRANSSERLTAQSSQETRGLSSLLCLFLFSYETLANL